MLAILVSNSFSLASAVSSWLKTMSHQRGTPRRRENRHGIGYVPRGNLDWVAMDGYADNVSSLSCVLIDSWETWIVFVILASRRHGGQKNYYWLVKNIMGTLVEEIMTN